MKVLRKLRSKNIYIYIYIINLYAIDPLQQEEQEQP